MGNALKIATELELQQNCHRLTPQSLDDRVPESIPAIKRAVTRVGLGWELREPQSHWQTAPIFKNVSIAECEEIVSSAEQRRYESRHAIVREGDKGGEVLLLVWGRVKVSQVSHTGDEVILRVKRAGDVIGGLGMTEGETHSSTIRALEPCKVLSWSTEDFEHLCERFPSMQRNALQIMKDKLHVLQECFCELATLRVPSRLARTLLRLVEQGGYRGQNAPITFTCEELGQMAGTTLFTVSRLLCKWTEMGLISPENRGIAIQDMGGLLAIADEVPGPVSQMTAR